MLIEPFEPATSNPSAKLLPNTGSVNTIASSFTSPCWTGVTSFQVAFAGVTESSNVTRDTCVPAMYIAFPVFQFSPREGSPAFCRRSTSTDWYPAGGDTSVKRGAVELNVGFGGAGSDSYVSVAVACAMVGSSDTPTYDSIVQTPDCGFEMFSISTPSPVLTSSGEPGPLSVPSGANAKTSMSSGPALVQV